MIYTLTFNPAIDYYLSVDDLILGAVNRTKTEQIRFGGKGINVSFVLKELGVTSTALGFVGGFTGDALENHLKSKGIKCDILDSYALNDTLQETKDKIYTWAQQNYRCRSFPGTV